MALCGATFFCALFFNNAGEIRPPDCKWCEQTEGMEVCEPLYPDWVPRARVQRRSSLQSAGPPRMGLGDHPFAV